MIWGYHYFWKYPYHCCPFSSPFATGHVAQIDILYFPGNCFPNVLLWHIPYNWNTCQTANHRIISVLKGKYVNINTSFKNILKLSTSTQYQLSPKRYFATNWCLYVVYSPVSCFHLLISRLRTLCYEQQWCLKNCTSLWLPQRFRSPIPQVTHWLRLETTSTFYLKCRLCTCVVGLQRWESSGIQ